ncbi:MAG: peroxiredoxin family protein [Candidatus Promineifilaceae bacterium]|nr:peroxiredoxin family protein [Candidatus Promineifilaceae bacterium]
MLGLAPDFTLVDLDGKRVSLSDFRERYHVVLVFNRGFSCPFCRRHLAQLRRRYQDYRRRGAELLVIGPEEREQFMRYWQRARLPFVGLPDPEHVVADRYGQEVRLSRLGRLPALVVVDREGRVAYRHYGRSMRDIPPDDEIVALLDRLNEETETTEIGTTSAHL